MKRFGWLGLIDDLKNNKNKAIEEMKSKLEYNGFNVSEDQILAWKDCIEFLCKNLPEKYKNVYLCFEYFLPRMDQRRPDVILFLDKKIIILEFKMKDQLKDSDVFQAINYREDILKCHKETWKKEYDVISYLVLTKSDEEFEKKYGLPILTRKNFIETMEKFTEKSMPQSEIKEWIKSIFESLPEVIEGVIALFETGELPDIKNIKDSELIQTEEQIKKLIKDRKNKKQIILITGVPGAGKTLLALKSTYENNKNNISTIYLSRNGPLISILQNKIQDKVMITGVLNYVKTYYNTKTKAPEEVIIFDEAQRAWDAEKMSSGKYSEVEALLEIGNQIYEDKGSATILAMIGHGQEIHEGEEKGIKLWMEELEKQSYEDWIIYSPLELKNFFKRKENCYFKKELFIDTSIRSNFIDITEFKEAFLKGNQDVFKISLQDLYSKGYEIYWTSDINKVNNYLEGNPKNTSCLIGSSGVDSKNYEKIFKRKMNTFLPSNEAANWYKDKDINTIATEFTIQGLDVDYPVVVFGGDYFLNNKKWQIGTGKNIENKKKAFKNINKLMKNIYNVLLTRGRKGMLFYIPEELVKLNELKDFIKDSGMVEYI